MFVFSHVWLPNPVVWAVAHGHRLLANSHQWQLALLTRQMLAFSSTGSGEPLCLTALPEVNN